MTDKKRTTICLDADTNDYIKWKTRGAGYQDGNTMRRIVNTGIRILIDNDMRYQGQKKRGGCYEEYNSEDDSL